jgi:hypothetical protein
MRVRPGSRHLRTASLLAGATAVLTVGALAGMVPGSDTARAAASQACDIYAAAGTPCVAAHSTTRAL